MLQKILHGLRVAAPRLVPFLVLMAVIAIGYFGYPGTVNWYLSHLGFIFLFALFLFHRIGWFVINNQRKQAAADPKNKTVLPKPALPPYGKAWKDWFDLVIFVDTKKRRIFNLALTVITVATVIFIPFGRTEAPAEIASYETLLEGWSLSAPMGYMSAVFTMLMPALWFTLLAMRNKQIGKEREEKLKMIYALASSNLKYPKKSTRLTPEEQRFKSYRTSVIVKQWRGLTDPEIFFIASPIELDIDDKEPWTKLQSNLETKLPSDTGWHIEFDPQGRGATIMPASYPMSVLWDGEQDQDPLTFLLGADLDNPGEFLRFTFSETSPHSATVGGTGSGKTSVTEAIMAQAATKPMPWSDPDDPIYAQIYVIDPKGPLANRWEGRPNVKVVNGTKDVVSEDGETLTGVQSMKELAQEYYDEMNVRGQLIDSYRVAKWLDLPDDILRQHRMAPWFLVLDEYLDHTDKNSAKTDLAEIENQARAELTEKALLVARKGRSFGFHEMIIAQTANMTLLGAPLMRQLIARIIMGNMDQSTYQTFFGTTDVPLLPTTRISEGKKKGIPGRGRIMNAPGQEINRMQAFWFGGKENSETLDKHLPQTLPDDMVPEKEMAEADIDDYDIDELGPTVDLSEENVSSEAINDEKVKPRSKPETKKENTGEVVSAKELFAEPEVEESDESPENACYTGEDSNPTQKCANPKCDKYVCKFHKKSPDGEMWACAECAKKHILSKVKLASLYPFAKQKVEKLGGSISYKKNQNEVTVSIRMENVEVMKIVATPESMRGMDGNSIVDTNKEIRSMITESLR